MGVSKSSSRESSYTVYTSRVLPLARIRFFLSFDVKLHTTEKFTLVGFCEVTT
jgi:hypothetical protein